MTQLHEVSARMKHTLRLFVEIVRLAGSSTDANGICQAYFSLFVLFHVFPTVHFLTVHMLKQHNALRNIQ